MSRILIIYSTTDSHTRIICRKLCQVVEQLDHQITLISIDDESNMDLESFDKIIITVWPALVLRTPTQAD